MSTSKMNEQTVLTDYFTAAKSKQGFQPAKRRKVIVRDADLSQAKSVKPVDGISVSTSHAGKTTSNATQMASLRTKESKRTRPRNIPSRRTRKNVVADEDISQIIRAQATSVDDDHEDERPRKQPTMSINFVSEASTPTMEETSDSSETCTGLGDKRTVHRAAKRNTAVQRETCLKINPWISEQARLVLASRGKRALQKSIVGSQAKERTSKSQDIPKPKTAEKSDVPKLERSAKEISSKPRANIPRLQEGIGAPSSEGSPTVLGEASGSKLPAYKRFSHLLEAKQPKTSGVTRNLPLPYHFKVLEEMFRCVDVVLSLKQKRYETCTFNKLKESVQEMCRKKFEKKHLAQMKTVYPTAFVFRQQNGFQGQKKSEYQLTVDFNMDALDEPRKKGCRFIESAMLIARQKQFRKELLTITMKHHHEYLAKNHPSMSVDDDAIMRWHPCFRVDEIPEINISLLPEPPHVKTYSTAQDVLDRARENMAPRVQKSLNQVAQKSKETNSDGTKEAQHKNDAQVKLQNPSLKGISRSLIEKIRQKEEKKIQEALTVDPDIVRKRVMVQRLPELCRILKSYFVSERKAAIPLEDASNKLAESYTSSLSSVQVEKHLRLLSDLVPEWLSIMYVRKCPYVKLKKNMNINSLIEKLKTKEIN